MEETINLASENALISALKFEGNEMLEKDIVTAIETAQTSLQSLMEKTYTFNSAHQNYINSTYRDAKIIKNLMKEKVSQVFIDQEKSKEV